MPRIVIAPGGSWCTDPELLVWLMLKMEPEVEVLQTLRHHSLSMEAVASVAFEPEKVEPPAAAASFEENAVETFERGVQFGAALEVMAEAPPAAAAEVAELPRLP